MEETGLFDKIVISDTLREVASEKAILHMRSAWKGAWNLISMATTSHSVATTL